MNIIGPKNTSILVSDDCCIDVNDLASYASALLLGTEYRLKIQDPNTKDKFIIMTEKAYNNERIENSKVWKEIHK